MNTRTGRNSETDLCACGGKKKRTVNPVIFNLLCLHENASERDDMHAAWFRALFCFAVHLFSLLQSKTVFHQSYRATVKVNYCSGRFSEAA